MMTYQVSADATLDHEVRTREILAAKLSADGRDAELDVWLDSGICRNGAGEDISDEYETAADEAAAVIAAASSEYVATTVDGVKFAAWQGRDGWYWTVSSTDSIEYDDDHGPYEFRDEAVDAALDASEAA